jgi:hypothetical protein
MIIFFLEWYWGHNGACESLCLPWRRRQHDAVVASAVFASLLVDRSGLHFIHLLLARADSASVLEVTRRFGMSSGQDVSVKGLKS